jgi:hypothetical protein
MPGAAAQVRLITVVPITDEGAMKRAGNLLTGPPAHLVFPKTVNSGIMQT